MRCFALISANNGERRVLGQRNLRLRNKVNASQPSRFWKKVASTAYLFATALILPAAVHAQSTASPIVDWQKRLTNQERMASLGSNLMGDSIDLNMGSIAFEHTDINIPGNNSLDVSIRRQLTQGYKYDEGVNVEFGDWELILPKITTVALTSLGWAGQRCNGDWDQNFPSVQQGLSAYDPHAQGWSTGSQTSTLYRHSYMDGVSVVIPGQGSQTLLKNGNSGQFPASAKASTASEWYFTCPTEAATDGKEGFIGHAPNGHKYHFKKFISRPYKELGFAGATNKIPRVKISLSATRVEDQYGNFVDYTYSGDKLTKIESSDGRIITIGYSGDALISSVTANSSSIAENNRIWNYAYRDSVYVKHDWDVNLGGNTFGSKVLDKVTQPDGLFWEFDLDGMQAESSPAAKLICGSGGGPVKLKHPYGTRGDFRLMDTRHRQSKNYYSRMTYDCEKANGVEPFEQGNSQLSSIVYNEIRSTRSLSVTSKKITLTNDEELEWTFEYEQDDVCGIENVPCQASTSYIPVVQSPANLYYIANSGPYDSENVYTSTSDDPLDYTNWTRVTDPEDTTVTYYHLWSWEEVFGGKLIKQETHKSSNLLDEIDYVYIQNGCGSPAIGIGVAAKSNKCSTHTSQTVQSRAGDTYTSEYTYKTDQAAPDYSYGRPTVSTTYSDVSGSTDPRIRTIEYLHDHTNWILGLPTRITLNARELATYQYNSLGNKTSQSRYGQVDFLTFTYNSDGTIASYEDALGRKTEAQDWKRGAPEKIIQAAGTSDQIILESEVDDNGWVTSQTDALNRTTAYQHDNMGRLTQVTPHGAWSNTTIGYTFPSTGGATQTITKGQAKTTVTYDSMFRSTLEKTEDMSGTWESYVNTKYDGLSRVIFKSQPSDSATETNGSKMTYDGLGRILTEKEEALGGGTTTHSYHSGHRYQVTDPAGFRTNYYAQGYDGPAGKDYINISNSDGPRYTTLTRNIWGEITQVQQSGSMGGTSINGVQYFEYDSQRRLCRYRDQEGGTTLYAYDDAGQMTSYAKGQAYDTGCTAPSGIAKVEMEYDDLGRLTKTDFADTNTPDITRTYDANGNVKSVKRGDAPDAVNWYYGYHPDADLLTSETVYLDNRGFATSYEYNADQHLIKQIYPTGRPVDYEVDGLGRPTKLSGWNHTYVKDNSVTYHPSGTLTEFEYGNGQVYLKELNERLLPERLLSQKGGTTALDLNYAYDSRGKITSITDSALTNNDRSFTYDALGQLATATGPWGTQTNTYDSLGNILTRTMTGAAEGNRTITLGYDTAKNRVNLSTDTLAANSTAWGGTGTGTRAVGYDSRGNVTSLGLMSFVYDYSDQPTVLNGSRNGTNFNSSSYVYDGNLKRVKSTVNGRTIYNIYSLSGKLLHVRDEDPLDGGLLEKTDYIAMGGMAVARAIQNQGLYYEHSDHLGSPVAQTYHTGGIATQSRYTPFGMAMDDPNLLKDQGGFTGHIKDSATGLNYMQARHYDPVMGRFLSVDPVTFLHTGNPAMFNRYAYTYNDPINAVDPDGALPVFVVPLILFIAKEIAAEGASQATGGATDFLSVRRTGTKAVKFAGKKLIKKNADQGEAGEAILRQRLNDSKTFDIVSEKTRINTPGEGSFREVDFVVKNKKTGELCGIECKTGGATRNKSQLAKDKLIADPNANTTLRSKAPSAVPDGFKQGDSMTMRTFEINADKLKQ